MGVLGGGTLPRMTSVSSSGSQPATGDHGAGPPLPPGCQPDAFRLLPAAHAVRGDRQERLHGCIRLLQPCSGNLLPAAGHSDAELWLPEPAGWCLRPPRQSQTEAAKARGEPALNHGSLLTLAVTLKSNPSKGGAVLLSGKPLCFTFPGIVLFLGTAVFECLLLLLWIRAGGGCSSGWQT